MWRLMVISSVAFGLGVMVLGLSPVFFTAFVVVAFVGAGTTGYQSLSNTITLNMTEDTHHGRVQSLMMLSFAGFGIAAAPLGLLAEAIGLRQAIACKGAVTLATVWATPPGTQRSGGDRMRDRARRARRSQPDRQLSAASSAARFARACCSHRPRAVAVE